MEIVSFKKTKNNKYEIKFKDNSSIELYDDVIIKYNLLVNKSMDSKKFTEIINYNSSLDAYFLSLKYLNSKMRTKLEIKKYLEKKEFDSNTITKTIDKLIKNKAIDEDLYIKSYVNDQINFKLVGPFKIANKLHDLGIDKQKALEYINSLDKNIWYDKLNKIINKKIKTNKTNSPLMLKNKILSSLYNDGYDKEMITTVLGCYDIDVNEDALLKEYNKYKIKLSKKFDGNELDFQIKMKLRQKGYLLEDIEKITR